MRIFVERKIEKWLKGYGRGKIVFADNFIHLGNAETINKALHRLKVKNVIVRIASGIYLYPKKDAIVGILYPTIEEIAKAIAKRDHARIIPTGIYALNKLGLSTQIPMKFVYLTDGSVRSIKINDKTIKFKKISPKYLAVKGDINNLVIQGLREIGKNDIKPHHLKVIQSFLEKEKLEYIKHDALKAPAWIRKIMLNFVNMSIIK